MGLCVLCIAPSEKEMYVSATRGCPVTNTSCTVRCSVLPLVCFSRLLHASVHCSRIVLASLQCLAVRDVVLPVFFMSVICSFCCDLSSVVLFLRREGLLT